MDIDREKERLSIIAMNLAPEIGPHRFKNLIGRFGSAADALAAGAGELAAVEGISQKVAQKLSGGKLIEDAEKEIKNAGSSGIEIITCVEDEYPAAFKDISGGPLVIYVKGSILPGDSLSVAIVGTRRPTSYGRAAAGMFSRELAGLGATTVSGLARGIDTEVHTESISAGGRTIAFLGNGLNIHYPPENRKLEDNIVKHGALISEFPLDTQPDKGNFPRRNRLISAFSLATLVVEAAEKSGALITAKYCAEQGKDVFAVPGPVFSSYSKGPHMLLKQGARLAENSQDIIDEIGPLAEAFRKRKPKPAEQPPETEDFDGMEERIMKLLENDFNGISAERLSSALGLAPAEVFATLTTLEIKGYIRCLPGKSYIRNFR